MVSPSMLSPSMPPTNVDALGLVTAMATNPMWCVFCPVGFLLAPLGNGRLGRSWVLGRFWVSGRRGLVWASSCLVWAGLGFWPVCGLVWAGSRLIWGGFRPAPDRPRPDPSLFAHLLVVKPLVRHTGRREIKKTSGSTQTPVTYDPYYYHSA